MAAVVKQVGRIQLGDHLCLPFASEEEQRQILTAFIVDGLARGEKVVYVSDGTVAESVTVWLRASGIDSRPAWARRQLEVRSAVDVYAPSGRFDVDATIMALASEVSAARQAGFKGLRLAGEMSWARRGVPGSEKLAEFEKRSQPIYDARGVTGICQYDRRVFDADDVARYSECHWMEVESNALYDESDLRITPTFVPRGLRIVGTIDRTTCGGLADVLTEWAATQPGDIHLDMAALHFIDVAGLRVIVKAARQLDGRTLHLDNLAPMLRKVIALVGWGDTPGLVLTDDAVRA